MEVTAGDPSSSASRIKGERRGAGGPGCGPAAANGSGGGWWRGRRRRGDPLHPKSSANVKWAKQSTRRMVEGEGGGGGGRGRIVVGGPGRREHEDVAETYEPFKWALE